MEIEGLEPSADNSPRHSTMADALRTLSHGLAQLAEALDDGADVPVGLDSIVGTLVNGHYQSTNGHGLSP